MSMIKLAIAAMACAASISGGGSTVGVEELICKVEPLEHHGFMQVSEFDEYVCVNPSNISDFVVITDEYSEYRVGDLLIVTLNKYGEVLPIHSEVLSLNEKGEN